MTPSVPCITEFHRSPRDRYEEKSENDTSYIQIDYKHNSSETNISAGTSTYVPSQGPSSDLGTQFNSLLIPAGLVHVRMEVDHPVLVRLRDV